MAPPGQQSHKLHETYGINNPVPKVSLRSIVDPRQGTESKAKKVTGNEREEEQKQNEKYAGEIEKEAVQVKDPVTGDDVKIKHGDDEPDPRSTGENILEQDFPPPDWAAHRRRVVSITTQLVICISLAYALSPLIVYMLVHQPLFPSSLRPTSSAAQLFTLVLSLVPPTLYTYGCMYKLRNDADSDFDDRLWHAERERGWRGGQDRDNDGTVEGEERFKESAEWVNDLVKGVWPIINPDLFDSLLDMLEDIMQSSVPRFIHSVRVSDFGFGTTPMRITSVRSLPDAGTDTVMEGLDEKARDHLNAEHINLEVSFAYRAMPSGSTVDTKAHNPHLLTEFFLGMRGVFAESVPVWVELTGVAGTARLRMELIPDPPFIKTTLVTLMGLPSISLSVVPMSERLPNVMNVPLLSDFIAKSINAAAAEYVAPKSLTLDLQQLISGDDIKKDTQAMGVLIVHIHRAVGLKKMDASDEKPAADPYVTLTFSKQGKPLFSTRIIEGDLNPVFEETAALPVDPNTVKIGEKLSLQVWDSDRASADDMMGFVEVDIIDLMREKNTPVRRWTPLASPDDQSRPGEIEYTVGYYSKMAPNTSMKTDGSDPGIPEDLKNEPAFQQARAVALNDLEAAVLCTPPDPAWPSGILSVQVHEIKGLTVKKFGKQNRGKSGEKGQEEGEKEQEEGEGLPSSYACIEINDQLVYSTRVKPVTATPIFNAGTERFIRDWRTAHVSVVVRDQRMRENDPVLGMVFLKLSELLVHASEITRSYSLEHGVGYGRIRISVLFRPVQAKLPPHLLGFDTGTLVVRNVRARPSQEHLAELAKCALHMKTYTSGTKLSRSTAEKQEDGSIVWQVDKPSEIPVQKRYSSSFFVAFKTTSPITGTKKRALAVLWLRDIVDSEDKAITVTLWQSEDYSRLKHNYVPLDGDLSAWDADKQKMHKIGTVELDVTFVPGVTAAHQRVMNRRNKEMKQAWEEFDRREAAGLTDKVGQQSSELQEAAAQDAKSRRTDSDSVDSVGTSYTEVNPEDVHMDVHDAKGGVDEHHDHDNADYDESHESEQEGDEKTHNPIKKLKQWREHEHELGREHRGLKQAKPARTAEWIKDNVENAVDKVEGRFKQRSREPDVETEV
ncbi:hypothetical protein GLOTRDRAFT_117939 [Gloeophyllum trabeum ATCC 11539]|uniref:C2 domain-containing protein n=1 Tax=Gloeophyllum trabeum (strain ATCC 11539 / FP-39264 / Madison 617) TaxID=670483 RepID=S7PVD4_GLOTA|nr:uncharacterized protein GLOTRDRAFT_117939 [Gloeophyllum trabeum ATCC 11539]EPQ51591.1 hypothetical protein GLOTRDRAFT_117939 [Gloeophyllum trabeum ATCC 11539]